MSDLLRSFTLQIEIITAIFASIYYYKYKNSYLKYFLILLWYIVFNEIAGYCIREYFIKNNSIIYNIYYVVNFTFLFSVYRNFISNKSFKKYINFFIIIYWICCVINLFYEDCFSNAQIVPYIIASVFLIISILMYFIEILKSEQILKINRGLLFWISIGLLLFHIGYIPYKIIQKFSNIESIQELEALRSIFYSLILILNICYIIGFIWSHKMEEQKLQQ